MQLSLVRDAMTHAVLPRRVRPRIALYSHDTQGLGHIRRNLLLASAFRGMGCDPVILLLSGTREAGAFAIPPSVDCLTLPALGKDEDGGYHPRSLDVPIADLTGLRRATLSATLEAFDPDVMIVDKVPLGALGELAPALHAMRARGRARIVLGMREVLDDPATVAREWAQGGYERAIEEYYDRVWIYGDQCVFDPAREYRFSAAIAAKVRYTGYLNPRDARPEMLVCDGKPVREVDLPAGEIVLCEVGGGQDGVALASAFAEAPLAPGQSGVLVTGPLMPELARRVLKERVAGREDFRLFEFVTDACAILARASRVVAMGGYNTVCEVLAYHKPGLIVPRVTPRTEQLIRAERMHALGMLTMLHPRALSPEAIGAWLRAPAVEPRQGVIDMSGVRRLPALLDEVLEIGTRQGVVRAV